MKFFKYSSPPAKRFLGSTRKQNPYPFYGSNIHYANPEKFQLLTINPRNVGNGEMLRMREIKLLGVQIDEKLKKCSGPSAAKLSLYKFSILFHLTYCCLVWHFCNASGRRKLERIHE